MDDCRHHFIHFLRPVSSHCLFGALDSLNQMGPLVLLSCWLFCLLNIFVAQHWIVDGTTLGTCQILARRSCLTVLRRFLYRGMLLWESQTKPDQLNVEHVRCLNQTLNLLWVLCIYTYIKRNHSQSLIWHTYTCFVYILSNLFMYLTQSPR